MICVCVFRFYNNNNQYSLFFSDSCALQIFALSRFALEQLVRQSGDGQGTGALSDTTHHWGFSFIENVDIKLLVQCLLSFNIYRLIFSLPYNKLNKYCRISLQSSIPGNSQCINVLFSKNLLNTSKDPSSFENFKT